MNHIRRRMIIVLATAVAIVLAFGITEKTGSSLSCVEAAGRPVEIESCLISGTDVVCQLSAGSVPASDDGKFYVFANEVYQDGPTGDVVATVKAGKSVSVSFPLNYNSAESNLSRKFLIAVKRGGQMLQVSDEHYITNPEAIAAHTSARMNVGIKGILPDTTKLANGELEDLGIQQVVYNLLDNAIKFTDEGGRISISAGKHHDDIIVRIEDNGVGMDEETLSHIYEQFYRGNTATRYEGTGLGLSLVQRIIHLHNGRISAESKPGEGTCFTIALPSNNYK